MKRRKLFALLMTAAMAVSSMSMAVNVFAEEDTTEEAAESEEPAEGEPTAVTTVGPDDGTKFEMWSFVDLSLIHISEPTRPCNLSRMPSSA